MGKKILGLWAICVLGAATMACGDDGGDDGKAGSGGGADAGNLEPPDEVNVDCPAKLPQDGPYAQKGDCCYRSANSTRVEKQGDGDEVEVEYRLNSIQTINHPQTIGVTLLNTIAQGRTENEEQSILWRFTGKRENGELAAGPGTVEIGTGRYNCDGTYSFYSDSAAPDLGERTDASRWVSDVVPTVIDPDNEDRPATPVWSKNTNREFAYTPYVNSQTFAFEWELVTQGYDIENAPQDGDSLNCIGSRKGTNDWEAGGNFIVYTPLEPNNSKSASSIPVLQYQTYCQLVAFGVLDSSKNEKDLPEFDCMSERCEPGTAGCKWKKLPDSLCPETDEERALFGCHIGYENNPDDEATNCTQDAPTEPVDPDEGATSEGQCCDPLGESTTLPACNAYMLRQAYVAAAADIRDSLADELQTSCMD